MFDPGLGGDTRASWWHALFNSSEDALMVCNASGEVLECNRQAQRFYKREIETPFSIFDSLTTHTAGGLRQMLAEGRPQCETFAAVSFLPGGKLRMIVDLAVARMDQDHWLLAIKDATRRWRVEAHVHRLLTALDATPEVIFLTDTDYRITYVNAPFQSVTGHRMEEAVGRNADFLRAPGSLEKVQEYIAAVEAGQTWKGELVNRRRDGTEYQVAATISPIVDRQGELMGFISCERCQLPE